MKQWNRKIHILGVGVVHVETNEAGQIIKQLIERDYIAIDHSYQKRQYND